jgi:nicotinamidase-related amidase
MPESHHDTLTELDPMRTVLVVVDMENEFCKPGGKLYHPEGVDEVIPKLKHLLERCRAAGTKVIFVQSTRFENAPEFVRFGRPPTILKNTWGSEYIEELTPRKGEPIVEKHTHDCFYKTGMDGLLERLKIRPDAHAVIIGGINANICVYHAVLGFHIRHYHVLLPMDCCAGWPAGRDMLKTQMSEPAYNYNVTVTESEAIGFHRERKMGE